jgi:predicted nucleic acid-binding protein
MTGERVFVDTNILVYAYDAHAGQKRRDARAHLRHLWETETGSLSTQVLQEFYVTVTRKLTAPLSTRTAREIIATYRTWPVHRPDVDDLLAASELQERDRLSFWDAVVVVSAQRSGASRLLTEDLQAGRRFEELLVVNPFDDK